MDVQKEYATPPHIHPNDHFYQASLALMLQVMNTGCEKAWV